MSKFRKALTVFAAGVLLGGCSELTNLDVENKNNPDALRALASPDDVEAAIGSAFYNWHLNQKDAYPSWALSVAAGEVTISWGNFGAQEWGTVPQAPYINATTATYGGVANNPWYRLYTVISQATMA
jgi:hypothetical protein